MDVAKYAYFSVTVSLKVSVHKNHKKSDEILLDKLYSFYFIHLFFSFSVLLFNFLFQHNLSSSNTPMCKVYSSVIQRRNIKTVQTKNFKNLSRKYKITKSIRNRASLSISKGI